MNAKDLIAELEFELVSTQKLLNLVPQEKLSWQPHSKAMTLGQLAYHVANIPAMYLSFAQASNTELETLVYHATPANKEAILHSCSIGADKAKELLLIAEKEWQDRTWNLTKNGDVIFALPIPLFIRLLVLNHLCHHRGQLSAYLRTLDVMIPSIYGPSADENPFS